MPFKIPPELKKITPYVRRAEELDRDQGNPESRLVAYYCRQYAVHTGIGLATSPAGKACLGELLANLEGEKIAMDSFTRDESKFLCEKFAEKVYEKADQVDRAGGADKNTARTFYAAASFFEILQQFYGDDDESEEVGEQKKKAIYCKWKATEILKAIAEGRTPTPGGYDAGNENSMTQESEDDQPTPTNETEPENQPPPAVETVQDSSDEEEDTTPELPVDEGKESGDEEGTEVQLGPPPSYPIEIEPVEPPALPPAPPINIPKPPVNFDIPPPAPSTLPPPVEPPPREDKPKKASFFGIGGKKKTSKRVGKTEIADATELTRFAVAALEDKDVELAAERLQQALQCLGR